MTSTNLRPELAHRLSQRLTAFRDGFRQNLALIGPPGTGKTFQLQQLLLGDHRGLLLIYCPVYRESCRTFLSRLLCSVLQAGLSRQDSQDLQELLADADTRLPHTAAAARAADGLLSRRAYGEAFNRTLDTIPALTRETGRAAVLMLDEFLYLDVLGLGHAFHELGKRVMTWPSTQFILASSLPYQATSILRERLQLLFGQFELLTLETLEARVAAAWIRHELDPLDGSHTLTPFLVHWLGGYPWYLAVWSRRMRELAMLRGQQTLSRELLFETSWDLLGRPEGIFHQWCRSRVEFLAHPKQGVRAMEVLLQVAEGARTASAVSARIGRAGVVGILQLLAEADLVERRGTCWFVPDPLLRCWLTNVVSVQRAGTVPDDAAVQRRFDAHLSALWDRWQAASRQAFPERVSKLFGSFQDEMVLLSSKTGRLPKFERVELLATPIRPGAMCLIAEGDGRHWAAAISEGDVDEALVSQFDALCRARSPRPSRKLLVTGGAVEDNASLLAKSTSMWVWRGEDLSVLQALYGDA
ncbi:MAG TPA: AAA family ATPase [bacterium]